MPKLVCITGRDTEVRNLCADKLMMYYVDRQREHPEKGNAVIIDNRFTPIRRLIQAGGLENSSDEEKEEYSREMKKDVLDIALNEEEHEVVILNGVIIPESEYWSEKSYKVLVGSLDGNTVSPDKVITNADNSTIEELVHDIENIDDYPRPRRRL